MLFLLTMVMAAQQPSLPDHYRGPNDLGPYKIALGTPLRDLFRILGQPPNADAKYFCYRSRDGEAFLWFEVRAHDPGRTGDLLVSTFPNCRGEPVQVTRARIGKWRTRAGIGLGSPQSAIVGAYGAPVQRWQIQSNNPAIVHNQTGFPNPGPGWRLREWGYESNEDLRFAHFGLRGARVVLILIGNNE